MEFNHKLRLWLKSKKSRRTHLDTRVECGAAQSGRKIVRSVDVIKGTIQRPRGAYIDRDVNLNSRPSDSS